jgi:hypothetical protein
MFWTTKPLIQSKNVIQIEASYYRNLEKAIKKLRT